MPKGVENPATVFQLSTIECLNVLTNSTTMWCNLQHILATRCVARSLKSGSKSVDLHAGVARPRKRSTATQTTTTAVGGLTCGHGGTQGIYMVRVQDNNDSGDISTIMVDVASES